ncbi:MAG: class I SAM-dependent DNA methyltransferase [Promethearchaeota archaeon]
MKSVKRDLVNKKRTLGKFYTRGDVADLINAFCIKTGNETIADFSCGEGIFLIRAYSMLKYLDPEKTHSKLVTQLLGVDIDLPFISLPPLGAPSNNLHYLNSKPELYCRDFFDLRPEDFPEFDAVIGNPPYTRHERLGDMTPDYGNKLRKVLQTDWSKEIRLNRAGIHIYFILHSLKFLRPGGCLGLVISKSWLDADYGRQLRKFLLKNTRIRAIVESKVERWFSDADVNTVIVILEKIDERCIPSDNIIKFVQFLIPLNRLFPEGCKCERTRFRAITGIVDLIENTEKPYIDGRIRIIPREQNRLKGRIFRDRRLESKWGVYLRAPSIFFEVLKKAKEYLIPLERIAEVKRGFATGCNEFFYLTRDDIQKWQIEEEFWTIAENGMSVPNYVIRHPRESTALNIAPERLSHFVLTVTKDKRDLVGTNVLDYVQWGEKQGYDNRTTCLARPRWYDLGKRKPAKMLFLRATSDRPATYVCKTGLLHDQTFYSINSRNELWTTVIAAILNSSLENFFFRELLSGAGIALGLGALWSTVRDVKSLPILNPEKLDKYQTRILERSLTRLLSRPVYSVFEEIGAKTAAEVSINNVKPDRMNLDQIVFDAINLNKGEQLRVYRAVIDLTLSRLKRAKWKTGGRS